MTFFLPMLRGGGLQNEAIPAATSTMHPVMTFGEPLGADELAHQGRCESRLRLQPADCDGGGGRGDKQRMQRAQPAASASSPLGGGGGATDYL